MPYRTHLLVVGNRTIDSPELIAALGRRAEVQPLGVTLLVAAPWADRDAARERGERAAAALGEQGIEAEVVLGDDDPLVAVREAWDPRRHDEVVVSTLDPAVSHWLRIDLAQRVEKLCGCQVRHVISYPRPAAPQPTPVHREPPNLIVGMASLLRTGTRS